MSYPQFSKAVFVFEAQYGCGVWRLWKYTFAPTVPWSSFHVDTVWMSRTTILITVLHTLMKTQSFWMSKTHGLFSGTSLTLLFSSSLLFPAGCTLVYTMSEDLLSPASHHMTCGKMGLVSPSIRIQQHTVGEGRRWHTSRDQFPGSWKWAIRQELKDKLVFSVSDYFSLLCSTNHLFSLSPCLSRLDIVRSHIKNLVILTSLRKCIPLSTFGSPSPRPN